MSPNLRRAAHQALDLVLDALAEEQRETPAKKRKPPVARALPPAPNLRPDLQEQLDAQLARAGYQKAV